MEFQKITFANKVTGDTFSAAEATQIKTVVNAAIDVLAANYRAFFNIEAFGAIANTTANYGLVDNTTAVLAAIRACEAAGGGRVFVPANTYYCNTFSNANNSVLWLAQADNTKAMNTVMLVGEYPPAGIPYNVPPTKFGSIIASNANGVNGDSAILSAGGSSSNGLPNYISLITENLTFRTQDNPTLGCVNAYWAACYEAINCMCDTGVNQFALAQPTHDVRGFTMPAINNYGISRTTNCWVGGYPVGVHFSEHYMSDDTKVLRCKIALLTPGSYHTAAGTFNIFHCPIILKTTGAIPVDFHFDLERSNDGNWWDYTSQGGVEIVNTGGATGLIKFAFTKAGIGSDYSAITTSGDVSQLSLVNLRSPLAAANPIASQTVSGFTAVRNASTPSTVDLSWTADSSKYDGYQIIYRIDGQAYPSTPQVVVNNGGSGTIQATGIDTTLKYEFSIRGAKSGSYSQYAGGVFILPAGASSGVPTDVTVEESNANLTYNTFTTAIIDNGNGGSMKILDKDLTAYVKYAGQFQADHITVSTINFPDCYSKMEVFIDNTSVGTFNPIAASRANGINYTFAFALGTYNGVTIKPAADATFDSNQGGGHFYFDKLRVYKA